MNDRSHRWIAPVVVAALIVGLAGRGVGAYAVATTPARGLVSQGPVGQTGAVGPQGPQGVAGDIGVAGPAGPAGEPAATSIVASTASTTLPNSLGV